MVLQNLAKQNQQTRDNIATRPGTATVPKFRTDNIYLTSNVITKTKTLGNAWIVGSSTNGIVGTNTGTQGGGQQVVGGDGRVETVRYVNNPNNIFQEFFNTTRFIGTAGVGTDIVTGNGSAVFGGTGSALVSDIIYKGDRSMTTVQIDISPGTAQIGTAQVSNDQSTWQNIPLSTQTSLTNLSSSLYYRLEGSATTKVTKITITYS